MYIVIEKRTQEIVHVNPAPVSQGLEGEDVYFRFDPATMIIGKTDAYELPEHFNINDDGDVVPLIVTELIERGIVALQPGEKVVGNQIVEKTLSEKAEEGLITIPAEFKIVGEGDDEEIVEKTLSERVTEGSITLSATQKIVGEGENERLIEEYVAEEVADEK